MYLAQRNEVVRMIDRAKSAYYREKLTAADSKETFKIIHNLLSPPKEQQYPVAASTLELADSFIDFFHTKVAKIRSELDKLSIASQPASLACEHKLSAFHPVTAAELQKLIMKCPSKSCSQDPMPTWLLKDPAVLQAVTPLLVTIINSSLSEGTVPTCLKTAQVSPILKKEGMDPTDFKSYRPVSNLSFLSKLLERVVAKQLTDHMTQHNLHDVFQSAYRAKHSTETALIKIKCDIDQALERGEGTILLLLDLSAAFDTLDHGIILDRLSQCVGVTGIALSWFRSYLCDRRQLVRIGDTLSHPVNLSIGVPQGSVLGPLLFLTYMLPLKNIISRHGVTRHGYADDSQTYTFFTLKEPDSLQMAIQRLEECASDIRKWMALNKLKLNDAKSELLIIAPKHHYNKLMEHAPSFHIGSAAIQPSHVVKNLGASLDRHLDMTKQCMYISRNMYYHIRRIAMIKQHLDQQTIAKAIKATVTSRLDYCNSLLAGTTKANISRLQKAQNSAARLLTKTSKRDCISPILKELHWLRVEQRIAFKVLVHVYNLLHDPTAPQYLVSLLELHIPSRTLRSAAAYKPLSVPRTTSLVGDRAFSTIAPKLWNSLPNSIRMCATTGLFKKRLKTYLFQQ